MLKVRLQRVGRKNDPSFRMVVVESTKGPKTGNYIEMLGSYNPRQKGNTVIHADRVKHWISQGAQVSDTVNNLLINEKVIEGKKVNPLGKKTPIVKAEAETEDDSKAAEAEPVDNSAEADAPASDDGKEEVPADDKKDETPAEEPTPEPEKEEPAEEKPAAEEETKDEDKKEEA